ncbi:MAG TPA: DUF732 domain-containing protein [Mycobacterium sp.]|nr:DUF732 domain-containing protein [Mycobacterium sp.]
MTGVLRFAVQPHTLSSHKIIGTNTPPRHIEDPMRLLLATLSVCVVIGLAGSAHGDPDGDGGPYSDAAAFLASLHAAGIKYSTPDQAVLAAKWVCHLVDTGKSGPEVVNVLMSRNPGLIPERAAQFMAIAERSYCPQHLAPSGAGGTG